MRVTKIIVIIGAIVLVGCGGAKEASTPKSSAAPAGTQTAASAPSAKPEPAPSVPLPNQPVTFANLLAPTSISGLIKEVTRIGIEVKTTSETRRLHVEVKGQESISGVTANHLVLTRTTQRGSDAAEVTKWEVWVNEQGGPVRLIKNGEEFSGQQMITTHGTGPLAEMLAPLNSVQEFGLMQGLRAGPLGANPLVEGKVESREVLGRKAQVYLLSMKAGRDRSGSISWEIADFGPVQVVTYFENAQNPDARASRKVYELQLR